LREIQTTCKVKVSLDKLRGKLHISGSESDVAAAKYHIGGLGGPRKVVKPALWAELLRTRTIPSGQQAHITNIQQESGCRIHIERSRHEVRLFGHDDTTTVAERLLDELAVRCTEVVLPMPSGISNSPAVQAVADGCGVTLCLEERQVAVLGIRDSVNNAVEVLKNQINSPEMPLPLSPPLAKEANDETDASTSAGDENEDSNIGGNACAHPFYQRGHATMVSDQIHFNGVAERSRAEAALKINSEGTSPFMPWMGQQMMQVMAYDGSIMQVMMPAASGMAPGMMPAPCMMPPHMMQYSPTQASRQQMNPQNYILVPAPATMMPGLQHSQA
jgi:hypothetical protein